MFWTVLIFGGLALVFTQLGAYSVWVVLLSAGLKLAVVVIIGLLIALVWRKAFPKITR